MKIVVHGRFLEEPICLVGYKPPLFAQGFTVYMGKGEVRSILCIGE
jgi:hypothetical protein